MKRYRPIFLVLAILITVFAAPAQDDDVIRIDTDLVTVNVSVKDKNGLYVKGLKADQFEVFDGRVKQKIDLFSAEESSVAFAIIYDMHPTTEARTAATLESLRQFTKELPASDNFFVTVFNERGNLTTDFVPTTEHIAKSLNAGAPNSLYDVIYQAAEKLRAKRAQKQTLLVISDGVDHNSHHSYKELRRRLRSMNVQVYAVLPDEQKSMRWSYSDISRNGPERRVPFQNTKLEGAAISDIAKKSGGEIYSETLENRQKLYAIYQEIAAEMKQQYTLGFSPNAADGRWHALSVRVRPTTGAVAKGTAGTPKKKLALSYRKGYQSPPPKK
jgi:Ca-activated chloride channel family protein